MKIRSLSAQLVSGLLVATATLALTSCGNIIYREPASQYAGRPIPPSGLLQRVLVAYTANGSTGGLEILDGYRDLRSNVQNTIKSFNISGYSAGDPITIVNYPEQTSGYVLDYSSGNVSAINYSKESSTGSVAGFGSNPPSFSISVDGSRIVGAAEQAGVLGLNSSGGLYQFSLPNVFKVSVNQGNNVILAMVRNSNTLYRLVKLPNTNNPVIPPGSVDCEPTLLPVFCVVPVGGAVYDRPSNVSYSLDGNTVYVLNCGPECGGSQSSVAMLQEGALDINNLCVYGYPSAACPNPTTPLSPLPVANPIPVPGGVTAALSDGNYLYLAGQQLQPSGPYAGLFAGNLSRLSLTTYTVGAPIPISDGNHTRMIFADNNTLWIGSSQCANGVRAATAATELATKGYTDQAGNYNCLTAVSLGTTPTAQIVPVVVQSNIPSVTPIQVPYPNTNQNLYYYGSLTGICWVQGFGKVYTADGGQIHAFYTGGTGYGGNLTQEVNNYNITIQGTVLDVAYMDALTNSAK